MEKKRPCLSPPQRRVVAQHPHVARRQRNAAQRRRRIARLHGRLHFVGCERHDALATEMVLAGGRVKQDDIATLQRICDGQRREGGRRQATVRLSKKKGKERQEKTQSTLRGTDTQRQTTIQRTVKKHRNAQQQSRKKKHEVYRASMQRRATSTARRTPSRQRRSASGT